MRRKLVSVIMALTLIMGLCPSFSFADDGADGNLQAGTIVSDSDAPSLEGPEDPTVEAPSVSISDATITLSSTTFTYDGNAKKPQVVNVNANGVNVPLEGYTVDYGNNINAGTATVTVRGVGDYEGAVSTRFTITKAPASSFSVNAISSKTYDGTAKTPAPTVMFHNKTLTRGIDYELRYSSNKAVGTAKIVINGKGNFTDSKTVNFKIQKASVAKAKVSKIAKKTYRGDYYWPSPTVTVAGKKLKEDRDYELHYSKNLNAGSAKVKIKGIGNYKGTKSVRFVIAKASISSASVSSIGEQQYTGSAITPKPTVTWKGTTLSNGKDYRLYYASNVGAGTAKITIKGIGNYKGTKKATFTIKAPVVSASPSPSSGGTVYITRTGAKYHQSWCSYLRYSKIPIAKSAAIAQGYDACKVCRP